jgi:hypothetical protein
VENHQNKNNKNNRAGYAMKKLDEYEKSQVAEIEAWKRARPSSSMRTFAALASPFAWILDWIASDQSIQEILVRANESAAKAADRGYLLQSAGIRKIEEMQDQPLEVCDNFSLDAENWALATATTGGALIGSGGICSISSDIQFLITLALRTIHNIGLCYGYGGHSPQYLQFVLGIMAASAANSEEEKEEALSALELSMFTIPRQTRQTVATKAAQKVVVKGAHAIGLGKLAHWLGVNMSRRKALQTVPAWGGVVGSSVNWLYLRDVSIAARRIFQERWLRENRKII